MPEERGQGIDGVLIRGVDGSLYLLSDDELATYRLDEAVATHVRRQIAAEVEGFAILHNVAIIPVGDSLTIAGAGQWSLPRLFRTLPD